MSVLNRWWNMKVVGTSRICFNKTAFRFAQKEIELFSVQTNRWSDPQATWFYSGARLIICFQRHVAQQSLHAQVQDNEWQDVEIMMYTSFTCLVCIIFRAPAVTAISRPNWSAGYIQRAKQHDMAFSNQTLDGALHTAAGSAMVDSSPSFSMQAYWKLLVQHTI